MIKSFFVQGSASEPYQVIFQREGSNLSARCNCPAGAIGMYCKHRVAILQGSVKGIVSGNESEVAEVSAWLPGTDVEAAMICIEMLEAEANEIKSALSRAKKDLARAMRD